MDDDCTSVETRDQYRQLVIRELVETEQKYVWDLELLQQYVETASASVPYETLRRLFPNLRGILELHRELVVRNERMCALPWQAQRWGAIWIEKEQEFFAAYEPWYVNCSATSEFLDTMEPDFVPYNHLLSFEAELKGYVIKPVSRIHKYPLLLGEFLKTTSQREYPWYNELVEACDALKRMHTQLDDMVLQAANLLITEQLCTLVVDWKGRDPTEFGNLLQYDAFTAVRTGVPREYTVFLFENIFLCAREIIRRKKPRQPSGVGPLAKLATPLVLKGIILVSHIARAVPSSQDGFSLEVWWRDDDSVMQQLTLRCRTKGQMDCWHREFAGLIGGDDADEEFWCPGE